jgi:hypothetical protein
MVFACYHSAFFNTTRNGTMAKIPRKKGRRRMVKKCINCNQLKETVTKRSNLCKDCFEELLKTKIKE